MITIIGPTASGKTALAAHLAARLINSGIKAEIISGDSRQVYRGMDIGTGKDLADYTVGDITVPWHLMDICDPGTKYNIYEYQQDFLRAYEDCQSRGVLPILCGGSGLYVESVIREYQLSPVPQNPELRASLKNLSMAQLTAMLEDLKQRTGSDMHNKTDVDSPQRCIRAIEIEQYNLEHPTHDRYFPKIETTVYGVDIPRDLRRHKISSRLKARVDEGMIAEIKGLLAGGTTHDGRPLPPVDAEDLIYYGLEYKYVTEYIIGRRTYDDMLKHLEISIHQFAKRQMTWFRGMERRGIDIKWIDGTLPMDQRVDEILKYEAQMQP